MSPVFFLFAPLLAAVFYGLSYAASSHVLQKVEPPEAMAFYAVCYFVTSIVLGFVTREPVTLRKYMALDPVSMGWMVVTSFSAIFAVFLATYTIKNVSPTYAATVEISYVFFVPVFMWLLFRKMDLDFWTIIGGAVTLTGIGMVIYGRYIKETTGA
jgi:drug/metabolite transporter (DMT)-like permease